MRTHEMDPGTLRAVAAEMGRRAASLGRADPCEPIQRGREAEVRIWAQRLAQYARLAESSKNESAPEHPSGASYAAVRDVLRERDEARAEIAEVIGLLGPGGDGSLRGAAESVLADLHAHRGERDTELNRVNRARGAAKSLLASARGNLCRCCGRAHAIEHDTDCPVPALFQALGMEPEGVEQEDGAHENPETTVVTKSRPLRKDDPPGTPVWLVEDDGGVTETRTRSESWQVQLGGQRLVLVEGRAGAYAAERCFVPEAPPARQPGDCPVCRELVKLECVRDEALAEMRQLLRLVVVWWEAYRPVDWSLDQHIANPHVNLPDSAGPAGPLASAAAILSQWVGGDR